MNIKKVGRLESARYLLSQLKAYRVRMIFSIICGIIKEASIICAVGICAYMAAVAVRGGNLAGVPWLKILAVCVISRGVMTYLESYHSHVVAYHALVDYRIKLYDKFITLCPDILLKQRSGQVATTLMNDVEQLEWFYGHTVGYTVVVTVVCLAMTGFLGWLHWSLAIALVLALILLMCIPVIMKGKADSQGLESRFRLGEANSVTLEGVNGMNEILTLNWQERYKEKNKKYMSSLTEIQVEYARRMGVEGALLQTTAGVSAVVINLIGIWLVFQGKLEMEWYAVVGTSVWLAFNPMLTICSLARTFGMVFAASQRVTGMMETEPIIQDQGQKTDIASLEPEICFADVDFKYEEDGAQVLDKVSFRIAPGEIVALVGESGAGKTTCTNLLTRLWDVKSGSIKVGGKDIRDMRLEDLHEMISVVLQDVYLFNTTIRNNISLGKPDATEEEIIQAAQMAKIHDFIVSLPKGYDTITGERGIQMSGGQRQRIAIARALLKDSPILILDEAVSSLDTRTDQEIQETIRNLAHKKTILMVAHRLSTINEADRLIVLKQGKVVQQGTQEQLLQEGGYYRELIASQLKSES